MQSNLVLCLKRMTDALLVVRRMQEKYIDKEKNLYICFVGVGNAFNTVSRKVVDGVGNEKERIT